MANAKRCVASYNVRRTTTGRPDGRSLNRVGRPRSLVKPYEQQLLHDEFARMEPGDVSEWAWRTPGTYHDKRLRNAQCMYLYKAAQIYGCKVALESLPGGLRFTMIGERAEADLGGYL